MSAWSDALIDRLRAHISMMAPHQRDRAAGKLLIESLAALADDKRDALATEHAWRATVDDMLTVCHMVASDDPRESINRLINWHVQVALDPDVSSDAQALVDRGRCQQKTGDVVQGLGPGRCQPGNVERTPPSPTL